MTHQPEKLLAVDGFVSLLPMNDRKLLELPCLALPAQMLVDVLDALSRPA
jgi:hypothetical protein